MLDKVKKFVDESFGRKVPHFERTVYWIKKLKPNADESLFIAAYAHDIDRAFRGDVLDKVKESGGFQDKIFLEKHQRGGAKIIADFLKENRASRRMINRVKKLVERHEVGGDNDQNLLKDADSISFFENNIPHFVTGKVREVGKLKVRKKFDWMYQRITSKRAKSIAEPMYEEAVKMLESV